MNSRCHHWRRLFTEVLFAFGCLSMIADPHASVADEMPAGLYQQTLRAIVAVKSHGHVGAGWVVDRPRRLVVTSYHLVGDATTVLVFFPAAKDGRLLAQADDYPDADDLLGKVVDADPLRDLAIVQLPSLPKNARELKLATKAANVGDRLHILGNPGPLWVGVSVRAGATATKQWTWRRDKALLEHRCAALEIELAARAGDGGAPVLNDDGELIGVATGFPAWKTPGEVLTNKSYAIGLNDVQSFLEQSARVLAPKTAADFVLRGERLAQRRRFNDAFEEFGTALQRDKTNVSAYADGSAALIAAKQFDQAIGTLSAALSLAPTNPVLYRLRGEAYLEKKDFEKATADLGKAIEIDPRMAKAFLLRGQAWQLKGDAAKALSDFDQAVTLDSTMATALIVRGRYLENQNDNDKALADFMRAMDVRPNPEACADAARINLKLNRNDEALRLSNVCITQLDAEEAAVYFYRARALLNQGKVDESIGDFNRALKLDPKLTDVYAFRSVAYEKKGDAKRAQADLAKASKAAAAAKTETKAVRTPEPKTETKVPLRQWNRRYLKVVNETGEPLRLFLYYENLNDKDQWNWFPADLTSNQPAEWEIKVDQSGFLTVMGRRILGRRVRIWAEGATSGKTWTDHKDKDLWISPEKGYEAERESEYTHVFPKK